MYPFAHFMAGAFIGYLLYRKHEQKLFFVLLAGLIAIAPDFDFALDMHRVFSHSLFFVLIAGLITQALFKDFWLGCLTYASHLVLDLWDGALVWLIPKYWGATIPVFVWLKMDAFEQLIVSSIFGTLLLSIMLWMEFSANRKALLALMRK